MRRYATTGELAARYRVTVETIRAWARQGKIPSVRVGRRPLLFDLDEVDRCIRDRKSDLSESIAVDNSSPKQTNQAKDDTPVASEDVGEK